MYRYAFTHKKNGDGTNMNNGTEVQDVLMDMQRVTTQANRVKDRIIFVLVILLIAQTFMLLSTDAYYNKKISNMTAVQTETKANTKTDQRTA